MCDRVCCGEGEIVFLWFVSVVAHVHAKRVKEISACTAHDKAVRWEWADKMTGE